MSMFTKMTEEFGLHIDDAVTRLGNVIRKTPLEINDSLSRVTEANVYLKREDLQVVRSYKLRGAYNMMCSLTEEELCKGVVCASAGNHAQGVAYSCNRLKTRGVIFMPKITPKQKINQTRMFGNGNIEIILIGDTFDDCADAAKAYTVEHDMTFIPPFDHPNIIEGQGTIAAEILADFAGKQLDYVFIPVGGGGLCAGVGAYIKEHSPETKIIAVEPAGAPSLTAAFEANQPVTISLTDKFVDGAAVKRIGSLTYPICRKVVDEICRVPEGEVCTTILQLYNQDAIVVEPAGALSMAALNHYKEQLHGKNVVCIVSGSNNDINRMQEIKERSLIFEGLKYYFIVNLPQRNHALKDFLNHIVGEHDDIVRFEYMKKNDRENGPALVGIEVDSKEEYKKLIDRMNDYGLDFSLLDPNSSLGKYVV